MDAAAGESPYSNSHGVLTSPASHLASPTNIEVPQHSSNTLKRSSSVHFAKDVLADRSSMSTRNQALDVDEITPIRTADGYVGRSYNTTEPERQSHSSNVAKPSPNSAPEPSVEDTPSWLKRVSDKYGSVTLENKGSVARDHLALERTFLAWLRTSLAFASIGIAITQLFRLNTSLQNHTQAIPPTNTQSSLLPLAPLLGHGLPAELIPMLQQLALSHAQALPSPTPLNTLLDHLLSTPSLSLGQAFSIQPYEFDNHAATKMRRAGKPLGATFIGISIVVLLVGFHRYFESQYWIIRGKFPASRGSIALVGFIAGALIVASLVVVLVVAPSSYEKR